MIRYFILPYFTHTGPWRPHWREEGLFSNLVSSVLTSTWLFSLAHTRTQIDKHWHFSSGHLPCFWSTSSVPLTAHSAVFTFPLWSPWTHWCHQQPRLPDHNIPTVWDVPLASIQRHNAQHRQHIDSSVSFTNFLSHSLTLFQVWLRQTPAWSTTTELKLEIPNGPTQIEWTMNSWVTVSSWAVKGYNLDDETSLLRKKWLDHYAPTWHPVWSAFIFLMN